MNATTASIEQKANITQVSGNVQVIRDGFFLPAQAGMFLLPGDRIVSDNSAKAVIQFTGVDDALVIEKGAAATFNLEIVEMDQVPQWIATDLYGEGVYFDSQAAVDNATVANNGEPFDLYGLFGSTDANNGDSTAFPVLETIAGLVATAAIYSDSDNNTPENSTETNNTTESGNNPNMDMGSGSETNNPPPPTSNPDPEPEPEAGPLDVLDGLLGSLSGTASPVGSQATPLDSSPVAGLINNLGTAV